jgi:hypothetical protein
MTTTTAPRSTAIAVTEPVFSTQEQLALAGFLAGYTGLTREAYALDLLCVPRISSKAVSSRVAVPASRP